MIIVIVDALRFDMVEYDHSLSAADTPAYKNKLPALDRLLMDEPQHSRLFRFMADAPTTTMQRLKGQHI